jgi:hypothetical protein
MSSFTCSYDSALGKIMVSVRTEDDGIKLEYSVPEGMEFAVETDTLRECAKLKGLSNVISERIA